MVRIPYETRRSRSAAITTTVLVRHDDNIIVFIGITHGSGRGRRPAGVLAVVASDRIRHDRTLQQGAGRGLYRTRR